MIISPYCSIIPLVIFGCRIGIIDWSNLRAICRRELVLHHNNLKYKDLFLVKGCRRRSCAIDLSCFVVDNRVETIQANSYSG